MEYYFYYDNDGVPVWKSGFQVQFIQKNGLPRDGIVLEMIKAKRSKPLSYKAWDKMSEQEKAEAAPHTRVRWDSGEEEVLPTENLEVRDSITEREFRMTCFGREEVIKKIDEKIKEAMGALEEAENLSEKYSIPFSSPVSPIPQSYNPASFSEIFPGLDSEFIDRVTGSYSSHEGWEHSDIC